MCTVIYLPRPEGFIISSNRDESPKRQRASLPQISLVDKIQILSPVDGLAGGTWIGINSYKHCIVLLNGAFEKHHFERNYLKSRGLIVSEMLRQSNPISYWKDLNLNRIEPFTLIVHAFNELYHLLWDGKVKHTFLRDSEQPQIWSSATLYSANVRKEREHYFEIWLAKQTEFKRENLNQFLLGHNDKENGFVMQRSENIQTISISFLEKTNEKYSFYYKDLISGESSFNTLPDESLT